MSEKKTIEDVMAEYAAKEEKNSGAIPSQKTSPANRVQNTFAEEAKEQANNRMSLAEAQAARREEIKAEQRSLGMGYVEIPIEDLPSGGIFYPQGTKINIRAASGGDIRHWSMMNETELSLMMLSIISSSVVSLFLSLLVPVLQLGRILRRLTVSI